MHVLPPSPHVTQPTYATLLFVANVTQQGRRGRKIGSSDEPWNKMLQEAGLRDQGIPGCAEAPTTKVNVLALKEELDGEKELRRDLNSSGLVCMQKAIP